MKAHTFNIGKQFSETPSGRYTPAQGSLTGEVLREKFFVPLLQEHEQLAVELDDTRGYSSAFLEEAFGGLVRCGHFTAVVLHERLQIITKDEAYKEEIWDYINGIGLDDEAGEASDEELDDESDDAPEGRES